MRVSSTHILPWPLVRRNDHGHPVETLQYLLRHHGHDLVVDGDLGPETEAAVHGFQTSERLAVDGIVGPETWGAAIVQVRKGDRGEAVEGVQQEAAFRDLSGGAATPLVIDGIFGPKTDAWAGGFQEAVEIAVEGIVGPKTWRALVHGMLAG